jgi:hypothetical protein
MGRSPAFSYAGAPLALLVAPISLLALVLTWFLKELPLRDSAYVTGEGAATEAGIELAELGVNLGEDADIR